MSYDFHSANLRGADFRGKNLTGADFSCSDIRGANFRNTVLVNANFRGVKSGLSIFQFITYTIFVVLISLFAGLVIGYAPAYTATILAESNYFSGMISLIILVIVLITIFWQGLEIKFATLNYC